MNNLINYVEFIKNINQNSFIVLIIIFCFFILKYPQKINNEQ
jgi:hypothetical protein